MTADVRRELADVLPESLGPVGLRRRAIPALGVEASVTGYGLVLLDALLPTLQALIADAEKRAAAAINDVAVEDVRAIAVALGLGGHARPYSAHEVVRREILPALAALDPSGAAEGAGR